MAHDQRSARLLHGVEGLSALIATLRAEGLSIVGPTVSDGAIDYREIESVRDLPIGWSDVQRPGVYRLERRDDPAVFQYASTAQSWKRVLHPPVETLLTIERTAEGLRFIPQPVDSSRVAFLGVRACDLHAIARLSDALGDEPRARTRRQQAFIVAVQCGRSASTCFCAAMGTGPRTRQGFDLALTELLGEPHRFLVEVGSERGAKILERLDTQAAHANDVDAADDALRQAAEEQQDRQLDPEVVRDRLLAELPSTHWDEVARRCTACGACTMVCPTCFCSTIVDSSEIAGPTATRTRLWDSCFSQDFSYIHGGSVRASGAARYRQWITHKLAHWYEQFGTSGCVGCGRCITWCPVGIDIVEEATKAGTSSTIGR